MSKRSRPKIAPMLLILCGAFSLLVLLHTVTTPVFEAPDEVWHYAYVRWIAEGHGLPALDSDESGAYQEVAQPPLYYLLAAAISRNFRDDDLPALLRHNPGFGYQAPGTSVDNKNMLIHVPGTWAWAGAAGAIHATRLASWFFGLVTVVATWGLAYEATQSRRWALVTASLVAFQPQFVFLSSVVNNDSAAAALSAVGLWYAVRVMRRTSASGAAGLAHRAVRYPELLAPAAAAGAIAGLGALTKTSVLPIVLILGAVALWAAWCRTEAMPWSRRLGRLIAVAGVYSAVVALVGGWWYLRNAIRWDAPLGLTNHTQTLWGRAEPATLAQLLSEMPLLARSFWAAYGWGHVTWPAGVYVVLWGMTLPLLVLSAGHLWQLWARSSQNRGGFGALLRPRSDADLIRLSATLALLWLLIVAAALVWWMREVEAPHGRLLFPALSAWALLLGLGLKLLTARRPAFGRIAARALPTGCVVLAALAPGARIAATFALPRLKSPEQVVAGCTAPTDLHYGDQAQLLCAEVSAERVTPGEQVSVRACWTALAPMDRDYTVFVHLIGPQATRVMERHTYPGLGRYPTSAWAPGRAFCDTYTGEVAGWAEAPIRYEVEVGLFDAETGERVAAYGAEGAPLDPPVVGEVSVVPQGVARPALDRSDVATFDDGIALAGFESPGAAQPGSEVDVTLNWAATSAPARDYVAFVHLWQPGDPAPLAQNDGQPRGGWYPTSVWRAGDVISDTHALRLPEDLPPGTYPLWAGLYRPEDGTRLAAYGAEGRLINDLVPLGTLQVEP